MKLKIQLMFPGQAEAAGNFYANCLGGKISNIVRYKDVPAQYKQGAVDPKYDNLVMYSEFEFDGNKISLCDQTPDVNVLPGNNMGLELHLSNQNEIERIFAALSEDAQDVMPLATSFWTSQFGMLTDKYGITWMLILKQ